MARLYLHCAVCQRKQADGLLSGTAWVRHPAADGAELRICPNCKQTPDWQDQLSERFAASSDGACGD